MKIVNGILFKANWLACVIGGALWGALGVIALLGFSAFAGSIRKDLPLVVGLAGAGAVLDTAWIFFGILDYGAAFAPVWIIMLWVGLALTLNHAFSFMVDRPLMGALFCGLAAPMTYLGGQSLGAVVVPQPIMLGIIAVTWGILFWVVLRYLQGQQETEAGKLIVDPDESAAF